MKSKSNVSFVVKIMNCLVAIQNLVVQFLLEGHLRKTKVNSIRLGTDYGGWWVPIQITEDAENWQVISCGLGHDISFDREITSLGIPVLGVEVEDHWIDEIRNLSDKPTLLHLVQGYVGAGTGELDVSKLLSLVENQFGFGKKKFLKMDIEGAEISIIEKSQILSSSFNCVAF